MAGPEALISGRFRAHDTRSVSSSWALLNGASLKDIQQAAYWSSPNTFISCYLKDVLAAEASFASAVLKEELHNRFNLISEERVKISKHNSENLMKIG